MKWLSVGLLFLASVGCAETTYRTAQGNERHEESNLLEVTLGNGLRNATPTLLANGAVDLGCPAAELHVRHVSLYREAGVFLVEGCGQRATYVRDCRPENPQGDAGHVDDFGAPDPPRQTVCQLELIGKVQLVAPAPAAPPSANAKTKALAP